MQIDIQYVNTEPDWETKKFISGKLDKLQLRYDCIHGLKVSMKNDNNNGKKSKTVEIKMDIPDKTLSSVAKEEDFYIAAKKAMALITSQLRKQRITRPASV
jgi:ribosomal subunit interface protein